MVYLDEALGVILGIIDGVYDGSDDGSDVVGEELVLEKLNLY